MVVRGSVTGDGEITSDGTITVKDGGAIGQQGNALVGDVVAADMLVTNASVVELDGTLTTDTLTVEDSSVSITGDGTLGDDKGSALGMVTTTGGTLSMADDDFSADITATATGIGMKDVALTGSMQADEDSSLSLVGDNSFEVTTDSLIAGPISNGDPNGTEATLTKTGEMLTLTGSDASFAGGATPATKGGYTVHVEDGSLTLDNTSRDGTLTAEANTDILVINGESKVGDIGFRGNGAAGHKELSADATHVRIGVVGVDKLTSATGAQLSARDTVSGKRGAQLVVDGWSENPHNYADGKLLKVGEGITGFDKEVVHNLTLRNVNLVERGGDSYIEVSVNHKAAHKNPFQQRVSAALTASEGAGGRLGELIEAMAHTSSAADATAALNYIGGAGIATTMAAQMSANRDHVRTLRGSIGHPVPHEAWTTGKGCPQWVSPTHLWAMATGASTDLGDDGKGGVGYKRHDAGILFGGDVTIGQQTLVGLAAGYSRSHVDSFAHTISGDQYFLDLYGSHRSGRLTQTATLGVGIYDWSLERSVYVKTADLYADFCGEGKGEARGMSLNFSYEAAYEFRLTERQTVAPLFVLESSINHIDGFREGGNLGNAGLEVSFNDTWTTTLGLGARYSYAFNSFRSAEQPGILSARALLIADVGDVNGTMKGSFIGSGAAFMADSTAASRVGILLGTDAVVPVNEHWSAFGNVGFEIRSDYRDISAGAGVRYQF